MWEASAEYADGLRVTKYFPYMEDDNYQREEDRIHEIEEWLINLNEDCTWYSVTYVDQELAIELGILKVEEE